MLRFAVHRGQNDSLSVRGHRPSGGQDVQGGVHVGMGDMPAGDTAEHRLALAVFNCDVTTAIASPRCVDRLHFHHYHPGQARLFAQAATEEAPTLAENLPVQPRLDRDVAAWRLDGAASRASHRFDAQIFDGDQVVAPHQASGGLFDPVLDSISLAGPDSGGCLPGPLPSPRPGFPAGKAALESSKARSLHRRQRGGLQQLPVAMPPQTLLLGRCWIEPKPHSLIVRRDCDSYCEAGTWTQRPPLSLQMTKATGLHEGPR